jgi:carboxyl-terminal processing protease
MEIPVPEKKLNKSTIQKYAVVIVLLMAMFGLGFVSGKSQITIVNGRIEIDRGNSPATSADYSLLWEALDTLNNKFVDRPLDQQQLLYGAIHGLVDAAGDPYTTFLDPDEAEKFQEQLRGSFEGIGSEIGTKNNQIIIVAPLEDSPASRAGLLAGDTVLEIDGESTYGMSTNDAVTKIRGRSGTQVKLLIVHKDSTDSLEVTITRAKIEIKSVKLETKQANGKRIAYIKVNQFGNDTKALLDDAVVQITRGDFDGIILDLRNNPGGYLETAVSTISNWMDDGSIALKEIGYNNSENIYRTNGVPRLKGIKTVLLVNEGSASASEIVAGALQDYKVATLVGEKTFGKGSVQELDVLKDDSEIKVTIAKWYTPNGRGIDKIGLDPDIVIERTAEDSQASRDPQMDRALGLF